MRRLLILTSVLALVLVALYFIRDDRAPPTGGQAEPAPTTSAGNAAPSHATNRPTVAGGDRAPARTGGDEAPVQWTDADLSKRTSVQRDDDSVPWPKGAPPPLFTKATLQAIRAAVTPGVNNCIDTARAHYADLATNPDLQGDIMIAYTAHAAQGAIKIAAADVVANGFPDDDLVKCIKDVYLHAQATSPDQADGNGKVASSFTLKR